MPEPLPNVLTAGEASGAALGALALAELEERCPGVQWTGYGDEAMRARPSFRPLGDVAHLSGAGLVELLPRLPQLIAARRALTAAVDAGPPLAIFVDAPDLHLPLARRARGVGTRSVLLVAPQFWAWRPGRRDFVARNVDLTLCLFRFEVDAIRSVGGAAHWVGHPATERLPQRADRDPSRPPVIAVFPGSRVHEVERHLGPFLGAARAALGDGAGEIVVAWRIPYPPKKRPGVTFTMRPGAEVLADADVALVAAGTATLEAAALGVPTVCGVAMHPVTASVARWLVRTPHVALPNVLLRERVIEEHVQDLGGLEDGLARLLRDREAAQGRADEIAGRLKKELGPPGFARRVVDAVEVLL